MISLEKSFALYAQHVHPLPTIRLPLAAALGAVLAEPINAVVDLPMFTQSAVDGYALRCSDIAGASESAPATLKLVGEIPAGTPAPGALLSGCAARILTGGALPAGADASARQEIVERDGDEIRLRHPILAGAGTRVRGEELRAGDRLADAGQRLNSGLLAALAMAGIDSVCVRARPRIAVLVSGDEVAATGRTPQSGEIFDANGPLVTAWLFERGYPLASLRRVADDPESLRTALGEALDSADLVISTGGVSVGDRDYIPAMAQDCGAREVFWKVAQKPGKPLWFGVTASNKAFLGMPGNPAAVFTCLHIHAAQVLSLLEGEIPASPRWRKGVLAQEIRNDPERDQLLRVVVSSGEDGTVQLSPLPRQDSHMLSNLGMATGMAWIRRSETHPMRGEVVDWIGV